MLPGADVAHGSAASMWTESLLEMWILRASPELLNQDWQGWSPEIGVKGALQVILTHYSVLRRPTLKFSETPT